MEKSHIRNPPGKGGWRIPPPTGARQPLKVNVFERMQAANTELVPFFPYYGPGAFIPAGAIFRGEPGLDMGHFFHRNSVDEVACVYGAHQGMLQTGQVFATAKLHGVNSFLKKPEDPRSFMVLTVTQRQADSGPQHEEFVFRCGRCHAHLLVHPVDSVPEDDATDRYAPFATLTQSVVPVERLNADEEMRTCKECGYLNPRFPLDRWGWKQWETQRQTVNLARESLVALAAEKLAEKGV